MNTQHEKQVILHEGKDRGVGEYGWLSTRYSFSFAQWYDPKKMGFGVLRVLNDDRIAGGNGFGMHQHENMEIITLVFSGALTHTDSLGNTGELTAGRIQVMSAGSGIRHSEYNNGTQEVTLFQIWMSPNKKDVAPRYAEGDFNTDSLGEQVLVSPVGTQAPLQIHQNAYVSQIILEQGQSFEYGIKNQGNGVYFFVV